MYLCNVIRLIQLLLNQTFAFLPSLAAGKLKKNAWRLERRELPDLVRAKLELLA